MIVADAPPAVAVTVTGAVVPTALVVTVKYAVEFAPAAIVSDAGTITFALLEVSVTTVPPAGATPAVKTLICAVVPLGMVDGEQVIDMGLSALTVKTVETVTLSCTALIVMFWLVVGLVVVIEKVVLAEPAGTVTVAGTVAVEFDEVTATE